jgi:hypothetical protein
LKAVYLAKDFLPLFLGEIVEKVSIIGIYTEDAKAGNVNSFGCILKMRGFVVDDIDVTLVD